MKLKTVKSAKKRLIRTGSGKLMRRKLTTQHLVQGKSKRARRNSGRTVAVSPSDRRKIKRMTPYK